MVYLRKIDHHRQQHHSAQQLNLSRSNFYLFFCSDIMAAFDAAAPATWTVDNLKAQTNDALAALLGQHNLTVDKDDDRRDGRKGDARLVNFYTRVAIDDRC